MVASQHSMHIVYKGGGGVGMSESPGMQPSLLAWPVEAALSPSLHYALAKQTRPATRAEASYS